MPRLATALALTLALVGTPAAAHFQLVYTPDANLETAGELPLQLLFWHPMENGHVMDMAAPQQFFVRFRGGTTDLEPSLSPVTFAGLDNEGRAFSTTTNVRRAGDYTFVVVPEPYYEPSEDLYIQQFTKTVVNRGGLPTDWMEPVGLPAEIVPLNKPYSVVAGSTFSGIVVSNGAPVAGATVEVAFVPAEPDVDANRPTSDARVYAPGGGIAMVTQADGSFTFGIPKPGLWGFAAIGVGTVREHAGKELEQSAVLWVYAHELN